jgi:hypothetical protein
MPERRVKAPLPNGQIVDASEVPVDVSTERWSEVTLEDGTVLRIKPVVVSVTRLDGHFDNDGNPWYMVKSNALVSIVEVPEALRDPRRRQVN